MDLGQAIYYKLSNSTAITGLINNRIFPYHAKQGISLPYATYRVIGDIPYHAMSRDAQISHRRIEVTAWAATYAEMISLSTAIKGLLRDYSGLIGSSSTLDVQRIFFESSADMEDEDEETKEITYYRPSDYTVWHY